VFFTQRDLLRPAYSAAARELLLQGLSVAQARDRLQARYGLSRGQAYRAIRQALMVPRPVQSDVQSDVQMTLELEAGGD
jgi:AmiR/NasT family two-component response regulator